MFLLSSTVLSEDSNGILIIAVDGRVATLPDDVRKQLEDPPSRYDLCLQFVSYAFLVWIIR